MIASAHQSTYLPWLGTLHKMSECNIWIVFDDVQMEDSGYENRVRILGAGGPQWLTVPVRRSRGAKIKDLEIASDQAWARKHFRTLELAYHKAPFWADYAPILSDLYARKWTKLVDLNEAMLGFLIHQYGLGHVPRKRLSELGLTTSKSQLVLDACKRVGAWKYIFGSKGQDYADVEAFKAAGVEPFIQSYPGHAYPQQRPGFEHGLSALDALLNLGPEQAREVMLAGGSVRRMG